MSLSGYLMTMLRKCSFIMCFEISGKYYGMSTYSLKQNARQCRGDGMSLHVSGHTVSPIHWKNFLWVDANKQGFSPFLPMLWNQQLFKAIISTNGKHILTTTPMDLAQINPCPHAEADYHMMLHVHHASQGHQRIMIPATDTYVLVLTIAVASILVGCELWIAFGHDAKLWYVAAHGISNNLDWEGMGHSPVSRNNQLWYCLCNVWHW